MCTDVTTVDISLRGLLTHLLGEANLLSPHLASPVHFFVHFSAASDVARERLESCLATGHFLPLTAAASFERS